MTAVVRQLRAVRDVPTRPVRNAFERAQGAVRGLVRDVAADRFGGQVAERPVPGFDSPRHDVGPLEGLRAARLVRDEAGRAVGLYVAAARAEGVPWERIAVACGYGGEDGPVEVFVEAAGPVYGHVSYRCRSCGGLVEDYGPEAGAGAVDGHVRGCGLR